MPVSDIYHKGMLRMNKSKKKKKKDSQLRGDVDSLSIYAT